MFRKQLACIAGVLLIAASASALDWNDPHSIVDVALAASPALREVEANLAAAGARQKGAGAMPNPMLMAGVQNQQIDFSTDPNMTMYMAVMGKQKRKEPVEITVDRKGEKVKLTVTPQ